MTAKNEADARAMWWCPYARVSEIARVSAPNGFMVDSAVGGVNRMDYSSIAGCNCIASQCSQWRWLDGPDDRGPSGLETPKPRAPASRRGYCGAGGARHPAWED